ncbi:MAG: flagellar hook assembly protein FlgD [Lachnospiraceae bacterium]
MSVLGIDTSTAGAVAGTAKKDSNPNSMDKDMFLKLLVTQMQYQNPLEPTDNQEYMAQLAQFSTLEEMQNLGSTISSGQMMSLTGQYVILNVPDSAGNISQVSGLVDYVTVKEGETYFHINDQYYKSDYLDSVVSLDYLEHLIDSSKQDTNMDDDEGETETEEA